MQQPYPLEVFAVDPHELSHVNGVEVPDYGAFVARVLPPELIAVGLALVILLAVRLVTTACVSMGAFIAPSTNL
jgi:hypothetical protein